MLQYRGILKVKKETKHVSAKFKTRDFVLSDNAEKYPQMVSFQLTQDRCSLLDGISEGQEMTVTFGLKGREWVNPKGEVKYFNSLDVFRIEVSRTTTNETFVPIPDNDTLPF